MIVTELLYVVVVPLAVAMATVLIMRQLRSPPRAVWALAAGLGYIAGQIALMSRNGVGRAFWSLARPHDARDWLPLAVLLAAVVTVLAAYAPRAWRRWVIGLAALLVIGLPLRLLAGHVAQQWSLVEKLLHLALLAATLGLTWLLLASARVDDQPRLRTLLLVLAAAGTAVVAVLSGAIINGKLCGVVAAAVAGTAVIQRVAGPNGAAGVVSNALGGLIILGAYYAKLAPANAALVFLSIIAAAGRMPEVFQSRPAWQQAAARAALCLVPLAIAIAASMG